VINQLVAAAQKIRPIGVDLTSAPSAKLAVQNRVSGAAGPCWCCVAMAGGMSGRSGLVLDAMARLFGGKAAGLMYRICG